MTTFQGYLSPELESGLFVQTLLGYNQQYTYTCFRHAGTTPPIQVALFHPTVHSRQETIASYPTGCSTSVATDTYRCEK